ncbi:unnamed protein product [Trifolium pratense]|uniref:Uncharacterized protein n=1 Tax=Trifolium pratense TaxID=57577 RepID=A0ACB0JWE7_TRIPR|nr:unnamed protein product [Trifolium pratense]
MAKLMKYFFVIFHLFSLFIVAMNVEEIIPCVDNSECHKKMYCKLPKLPRCMAHICKCCKPGIPFIS